MINRILSKIIEWQWFKMSKIDRRISLLLYRLHVFNVSQWKRMSLLSARLISSLQQSESSQYLIDDAVDILMTLIPVFEKDPGNDAGTQLGATLTEGVNLYLRHKEQGFPINPRSLDIEKMTLTNLLAKATAHDMRGAIKTAMMTGNRERILRTLKEIIEEVEDAD